MLRDEGNVVQRDVCSRLHARREASGSDALERRPVKCLPPRRLRNVPVHPRVWKRSAPPAVLDVFQEYQGDRRAAERQGRKGVSSCEETAQYAEDADENEGLNVGPHPGLLRSGELPGQRPMVVGDAQLRPAVHCQAQPGSQCEV